MPQNLLSALKVAIEAVHAQSRQTYGPLRVQPKLAAQGSLAGRDRIVRLRRELALRCKQKPEFKATTNSNHDLPVAENLLIRHSRRPGRTNPGRPTSPISLRARIGSTWPASKTSLRASWWAIRCAHTWRKR